MINVAFVGARADAHLYQEKESNYGNQDTNQTPIPNGTGIYGSGNESRTRRDETLAIDAKVGALTQGQGTVRYTIEDSVFTLDFIVSPSSPSNSVRVACDGFTKLEKPKGVIFTWPVDYTDELGYKDTYWEEKFFGVGEAPVTTALWRKYCE